MIQGIQEYSAWYVNPMSLLPPWFLDSPVPWALEPGCEILMFMWSLVYVVFEGLIVIVLVLVMVIVAALEILLVSEVRIVTDMGILVAALNDCLRSRPPACSKALQMSAFAPWQDRNSLWADYSELK